MTSLVKTSRFSVYSVGGTPPVVAKGGAKAAATTPAAKTAPPPPAVPAPLTPEVEAAVALLRSVGEECVTESELANLVAKKPNFRLYDGFEPSGRMHIAQGVFKAMNVNKCTSAGGTFVFWVADWFALMNDKMGGDLAKIKDVGQYLVEVWRAAGMKMDNVEFRWASEEITTNAPRYWPLMLDVARRFTVARIRKCCQIMGRLEGTLTAAQVLYPLMQCTDVFFLKADICQLGVDQRKVNMLARDYCDAAGLKLKPVILSHHMLYGLKAGQAKMSKSDADSAIFMEDSAADVKRKLLAAYCPRKPDAKVKSDDSMSLTVDELKNPCLDYIRNIVFAPPGASFTAGGTKFATADAVQEAFITGKLSEADLKNALVDAINLLLEPVRAHFENDTEANALLERVRGYKRETLVATKAVRDESAMRAALRSTLSEEHASLMDAGVRLVMVPQGVISERRATLGEALSVANQLRHACSKGGLTILHCADWSCIALDVLNGDLKLIEAAHNLFCGCVLGLLEALEEGLSKSVVVLKQSQLILARPSEYWIDVINAGRFFPLKEVQAALGNKEAVDEEGERVGGVIAALMRCADITASCASEVIVGVDYLQDDVTAASKTVPWSLEEAQVKLATTLLTSAAPVLTCLSAVSTRLQGRQTVDDEWCDLNCGDTLAEATKKIKRSFCEPTNVAFCPPLRLTALLLTEDPGVPVLEVKRSAENGGDLSFDKTTLAKFEADFKSGALHPSDLKPALIKANPGSIAVLAASKIIAASAASLTATPAAKNADKVLKAHAKKMAKKTTAKK